MLSSESIMIHGKKYKRTFSDDGHVVRCGRKRYKDAVDPIGVDKAYFEEGVEENAEEEQ